jgi:carboxymethylenebutenolidase
MRARVTLTAVAMVALVAVPAVAQDHNHADHASPPGPAVARTPRSAAPSGRATANQDLPADEEGSKARLSASPRHGEWVKIDAGGTLVNSWVVYPERRRKAPLVVVIHEIFGLTDWIRGVADQFAAEGFIAIAPDLLSGHGPNGGGTDAFAARDDATRAVSALSRTEVNSRLDAIREYGIGVPAANGKSATVGFCWGGSSSFAYATVQPALDAAVVYYGSAPSDSGGAAGSFTPAASFGGIRAPVLGLYGGSDPRVTATVSGTDAKMKELKKRYEHETFEAAGHGFLRAQTGHDGANMRATERAWPRTIAFLRKYTDAGSGRTP